MFYHQTGYGRLVQSVFHYPFEKMFESLQEQPALLKQWMTFGVPGEVYTLDEQRSRYNYFLACCLAHTGSFGSIIRNTAENNHLVRMVRRILLGDELGVNTTRSFEMPGSMVLDRYSQRLPVADICFGQSGNAMRYAEQELPLCIRGTMYGKNAPAGRLYYFPVMAEAILAACQAAPALLRDVINPRIKDTIPNQTPLTLAVPDNPSHIGSQWGLSSLEAKVALGTAFLQYFEPTVEVSRARHKFFHGIAWTGEDWSDGVAHDIRAVSFLAAYGSYPPMQNTQDNFLPCAIRLAKLCASGPGAISLHDAVFAGMRQQDCGLAKSLFPFEVPGSVFERLPSLGNKPPEVDKKEATAAPEGTAEGRSLREQRIDALCREPEEWPDPCGKWRLIRRGLVTRDPKFKVAILARDRISLILANLYYYCRLGLVMIPCRQDLFSLAENPLDQGGTPQTRYLSLMHENCPGEEQFRRFTVAETLAYLNRILREFWVASPATRSWAIAQDICAIGAFVEDPITGFASADSMHQFAEENIVFDATELTEFGAQEASLPLIEVAFRTTFDGDIIVRARNVTHVIKASFGKPATALGREIMHRIRQAQGQVTRATSEAERSEALQVLNKMLRLATGNADDISGRSVPSQILADDEFSTSLGHFSLQSFIQNFEQEEYLDPTRTPFSVEDTEENQRRVEATRTVPFASAGLIRRS